MGLWHNIKVRLGLADDWDEEYDEYYEDDEDDAEAPSSDGFPGRSVYQSPFGDSTPVRRADRAPEPERTRDARPRSAAPAQDAATEAPHVRMHIVEPRTFQEAQSIADRFKQGTPVIVNMTVTPPDVAKRLIDFASGLTYGLEGGLQKVSDKVFMLTPANVDVSDGDVRRMRDKGMFTID